MSVGQYVRLRGLEARPSLNGAHAVVVAPEDDAESIELQQKQRTKIRTLSTGEVLSVSKAKFVTLQEADENTIFSTPCFAVVFQKDRGYIWKALRKISKGRRLFSEEPLLVCALSELLASDPIAVALYDQLRPHIQSDQYPPGALPLLAQSGQRIGEYVCSKLSSTERRRFMALSDAFAEPSADKSVGGIYRTNAFSRADEVSGSIIYEVLSRVNHS